MTRFFTNFLAIFVLSCMILFKGSLIVKPMMIVKVLVISNFIDEGIV